MKKKYKTFILKQHFAAVKYYWKKEEEINRSVSAIFRFEKCSKQPHHQYTMCLEHRSDSKMSFFSSLWVKSEFLSSPVIQLVHRYVQPICQLDASHNQEILRSLRSKSEDTKYPGSSCEVRKSSRNVGLTLVNKESLSCWGETSAISHCIMQV